MSKAKTIHLVVITPEREVLSAESESVILPAHDGELGVLHDRAPLMCELATGTLRFRTGPQTTKVMVDGGFAQVHHNRVIVLTEQAATTDEVDEARLAVASKAAADPALDRAARMRARRRLHALRSIYLT